MFSLPHSPPRASRPPAVRPFCLLALLFALLAGSAAHAVPVTRGDVTRDGSVTVEDAVQVLQSIVGVRTFKPPLPAVADVDASGTVDVADVVRILQVVVGLAPTPGVVDPDVPTGAATTVLNNETVFSWPRADGESVARLTFTQGDQPPITVTGAIAVTGETDRFTLSKRIPLQPIADGLLGNAYAPFKAFQPGVPVQVGIEVATDSGPFSPAGDLTLTPVVHVFDPEFTGPQANVITLNVPFPDRASVGDTITLAGRTTDLVRASAYYVPPSGFPVTVGLQSSQPAVDGGLGPALPAGSDFSMSFKVESEGVYAVEVNRYDGIATLNRPVYVGAGVPLIPGPLDFYTLPTPGTPVGPDLFAAWLAAVNRDRQQYGLNPVSLDPNLGKAAQDYANDMVARNFFGHTGVNGDSLLSNRMAAAGVPATTHVGENLSVHTAPEALEASLMASAGHRFTLLGPDWKYVGLGIARKPDGTLVGVQEFGAPLGAYAYPVDYFLNVILDAPVPSNLVAGQPLTISGRVTAPTQWVIVFLIDKADSNHQLVFGPSFVDANGRFSVPVSLTPDQAGEYALGVQRENNTTPVADVIVTTAPMTF